MQRIVSLIGSVVVMATTLGCTGYLSPYTGDQGRAIKAMSAREVNDTLAGRGMGLARAAELNGYPGPMHVLELASALRLTPAQRQQTEALFNTMQASAITAGKALIDAEQALDRDFATGSITPAGLDESLQRIGALQARVRAVHLSAHLTQTAILTAEQVTEYGTRRGYQPIAAPPTSR